MQTLAEALKKLQGSKFRSSFHLNEKDRNYIREKGMDVIESHARDFVRDKLSPAYPMKGHPVFKAMHATGCCCRGCLNKWYRVPKGCELSELQQEKIVRLLLAWIREEMKQ